MDSINTMFFIDLIIVIVGVYLLFLSFRMKKTHKVERFIVPEEALKQCRQESEFAAYLSMRMTICAIIMQICGVCMAVHESVFKLGFVYYIVVAVLVIAVLLFYKQLTDGKVKYC